MCFIIEKTAAIRHQDAQSGEWVRREGSGCAAHGARPLVGQFLPRLVLPSSQAEAIRHSHHYVCPRSAEKEFLDLIQNGHFPPLHRHKQPPPCTPDMGSSAARQSRDCTTSGSAG